MATNRLYILKPLNEEDDVWNPRYDKCFCFVVRATSESEARQLANKAGGDETGPVNHEVYRTGGNPWLNPRLTSCDELIPDGDTGVVCRDMRYG